LLNDFGKDSGESASSPALSSASTLNKNLRRSERVLVNLRVRISAVAGRDKDFLSEGQTIDVSHDGAAIIVDRDLSVGQTIKVRRVGVNKEAMARVVGNYKDQASNSRVFGIALTDNQANLWDIVFPTTADLDNAVLRALLRCVACGRLEVAYLNEFESDLFLNHHSVARICGQCGGWTTWIRPYGQVPVSPDFAAESGVPDSATQNYRSHDRLRTETVGCIRNSAVANDVVLVSDLGRGGLTFFSTNLYPEGATLEMAIPYTSRAPNVFSLVRIVGARKGKERNLTEYRATYLV
jgi:PilZ domain-containing protein